MDVVEFTRLAGILLLIYLVLVSVLVFWPLSPPLRRLFAGLTIVEVIVAWLHTYTWRANPVPFLVWFLDLNREFDLGATLSSVQLIAVALVAAAIGLMSPAFTRWQKGYWLLVAGVFAFLGLDEYYLIHEAYYLAGGVWQIPYAIVGISLFLISLVVWRRWFPRERYLFLLLFAGLVLMGSAGIVLDYVVQEVICVVRGPGCHRFIVIEEFSEMAGVSLALTSLMAFASKHLVPHGLRRAGRIAAAGSAIWLVWLVIYLWLLPGVEATIGTVPARVTWLDGGLELTSYRLSETTIEPGSELDVTLYLRANRFLEGEYSVSVNLFSHPDVESISNADMLLGENNYPTFGWLPGTTVRNRLRVPIPQELMTDRSYWLVARVWRDDWHNGTVIDESDANLFDDTTAILAAVAAPDHGDQPAPPVALDYTFADGFTLAGTDLPMQVAPGASLSIRFWWQTQQNVGRELTQFVHLERTDDDRVFAFDEPPFGNRFPTQDWPADARMIDEWEITLPPDLPAGMYTVYTGMYAPETLTRALVQDSSGAPVADNAIQLGEIMVTADP